MSPWERVRDGKLAADEKQCITNIHGSDFAKAMPTPSTAGNEITSLESGVYIIARSWTAGNAWAMVEFRYSGKVIGAGSEKVYIESKYLKCT